MKRPSSKNKRIKTRIGIDKIFVLFSNIWKRERIWRAKWIGKRANPCLTLTSTLKDGDVKEFYIYWVCLPIK